MTTRLILIRHGVTADTSAKRFSGGMGGANPPLSAQGRQQINQALDLVGEVEAIATSPVRRARESAELLAQRTGLAVGEHPGLAEMDFGLWEGRKMQEVLEAEKADFLRFFSATDFPAGSTGESLDDVQTRVRAERERLLDAHGGRQIAVFSHVTPIKILIADALGAPLGSVYRSSLAPGGVSVIEIGRRGQRLLGFNLLPTSRLATMYDG